MEHVVTQFAGQISGKEAQHMITLSMGKMQQARASRSGINLRRSLLVSKVLYKARAVYWMETYGSIQQKKRAGAATPARATVSGPEIITAAPTKPTVSEVPKVPEVPKSVDTLTSEGMEIEEKEEVVPDVDNKKVLDSCVSCRKRQNSRDDYSSDSKVAKSDSASVESGMRAGLTSIVDKLKSGLCDFMNNGKDTRSADSVSDNSTEYTTCSTVLQDSLNTLAPSSRSLMVMSG